MSKTRTIDPRLGIRSRQGGAALAIGLVLLMVATLIGLAGIRQTSLEERMSGNFYDRSLAMQVAEAALRAAEAAAAANPNITTLGGVDCTKDADNSCSTVPSDSDTHWTELADSSEYLRNQDLSKGTPQYLIQYLGTVETDENLSAGSANTSQYGSGAAGTTAEVFRIFSRSADPTDTDVSGRAVVRLGSTYRCGSK